MKNGFYLFLFLGLVLSSCQKNDSLSLEEQAAEDEKIILDYIADNNLTAQKDVNTDVYYVITKEGTGTTHPSFTSQVQVEYKGYLTDGSVFDQSINPVIFSLTSVIPGWQAGIPLLTKGGEGTLIIPSRLGYGRVARPGIPANSVLIFEVKLLDFI